MACCVFLPCARYQNQVQHCDDCTDDVCNIQRQVEANRSVQQEGRNDEDVECTRQQRDEECVFRRTFLCTQVNCDCCESEYCDGLVCPCEVSPQDVEAFCIQFRKYQNCDNGDEDTQCYHDTISFFFLVDVQVVRNHQTAGTQGCVTGSDGQYDNAQDGDQTTNGTQQVFCNFADNVCCAAQRAFVIDTHSSCSPDHSDQTFQNHHPVECETTFFFGSYAAADQCTLCGVETGCDTAGNGYEEYRDERCACASVAGCIPQRIYIEDTAQTMGEVNVHQFIALEEDAEEYANCGQHQDDTEDRVDSADDFIDGEQCCDQVVSQDHSIDNLCPDVDPFDTNDLVCEQVAGCVGKYGTYQQHQDAQEDVVYLECFVAQEFTNDTGHLCAVLTQRHHTTQVVMGCTTDDAANGNGDECDGPEQNALNGPEDRAGTCDVQQVDEGVFEFAHRNKVNTVLFPYGRCLPVVGVENVFYEFSVYGTPNN